MNGMYIIASFKILYCYNFQIVRRNLPNPLGIAIHNSDVYWVDRNLNTVYKASKLPTTNPSPATTFRTNLPRLRDVAIYDSINQPMDDTNPCLRLGEFFNKNSPYLLSLHSDLIVLMNYCTENI